MKKEIENIIKENLPEKLGGHKDEDKRIYAGGFDDALSQINPSLIADEVLKVVVEKIEKEIEKFGDIWKLEKTAEETNSGCPSFIRINRDILQLLSSLSPNKENK